MRVAQEEAERAVNRLAEPDQPAPGTPRRRKRVAERDEIVDDEALEPAIDSCMIAVPGLDVKARRDQRGVEPVVNVEQPELLEAIAEGRRCSYSRFDRQDITGEAACRERGWSAEHADGGRRGPWKTEVTE